MGDRANFGFRQGAGAPVLYLYGHWAGYEMMNTLAQALVFAKPRIDMGDSAYATRMAISHIVGAEWKSEYGFGLTIDSLCDNEHSIPIVDFDSGTVSLHAAPDWDFRGKPNESPIKFTMSIDNFIDKFAKVGV